MKDFDYLKKTYTLAKVKDLNFVIRAYGNEYHAPIEVNDTAAFIVSLFEKAESLEDLVSMVAKEYNIDARDAKEDVYDFLSSLK